SRVAGVPLDVTDANSVADAFASVAATWGGVDIVVVNAGLAHVAGLPDLGIEAFRRLERVNVEGALLVMAEAARHLKLQGTGGDIVLVSTKNVFAPGAKFGAYSATKAAAHQLARIASLELADIDVRVNMVAPDAVFSHGARRSGLWATVGPDRMRARGLDEAGLEDYYRGRNLLKARVTADHVGRGGRGERGAARPREHRTAPLHPEAARVSAQAGRRGLGATEEHSAAKPREHRTAPLHPEAARVSAQAGRRGLGATEEHSAAKPREHRTGLQIKWSHVDSNHGPPA